MATAVTTQARRQRELTPIQELIADEVADMLMHGGNPEYTTQLISAAAHHKTWRMATTLCDPQEQAEIQKYISEFGPAEVALWQGEMLEIWCADRRPTETERARPQTIKDRIRAAVINELKSYFLNFLIDGTPEEHFLLTRVLMRHESVHLGRLNLDGLPLGQAFEETFNNETQEWIKVPSHMRTQVTQYISRLKAAG